MIGRPTGLTEAELDRTLGRWFAGGPETVPSAAIQAALDEIVTTRQQRPLRNRLWRHDAHWRPAAVMAGAALTVLLGVTVALNPALVGIAPAASPAATSSPAPTARPSIDLDPPVQRRIIDSDEGFSLLLPPDWKRVSSRRAGTQRFAPPSADRDFTVSIGASVIDGGSVAFCIAQTPGHAGCADLAVGYRIPFDRDRSLRDLGAALEGFLDRCAGQCPVTRSEALLDTDPATRLELTIDARRLTYIVAMHGYRPVILAWEEPVTSAEPSVVEAMRAEFKYLDDDPLATPTADPFAMTTFRNEAWGYEVSVPALWLKGVEPSDLVLFGGLKILAGDREGRFDGCSRPLRSPCDVTPITTLAGLESVIQSAPDQSLQKSREEHFDTTLGGEPARRERVDTRPFLAGPSAFYTVYTIHRGRPLVLAFDHWAIKNGDLSTSVVDAIVRSVRFLD